MHHGPQRTIARTTLAVPALVLALVLALALLVAPALLVGLPAARADSPSDLSSQFNDTAGVLDDAKVQSALEELHDSTGLNLYVAFVKSFDGREGAAWAAQTASASGFTDGDVLLAVATTDRKYGYAGSGAGIGSDEVGSLFASDVVPHLTDGDWDGAAQAAVNSLGNAALARQGGSAPAEGSGSGDSGSGDSGSGLGGVLAALGLIVLLVVAVIVVVVVVVRRSRRAGATGGSDHRQGQALADPMAGVSTQELTRRADAALVEADDTVSSSAQELSFAVAEFGDEATAPFATALASAKQEVADAFAARRSLDGADQPGEPDGDGEGRRRAVLQQVLAHTAAAATTLEAQATAFAQLRDVEARLPEVLAQLRVRGRELQVRVPTVAADLEQLGQRWSPAALRAVAGNPQAAATMLAATADQLTEAETKAAAGDRGEAAAQTHAVEGALQQAAALLDAVTERGGDLTQAADALTEALHETDADLAQARGLLQAGHHDPSLAGLVARAASARDAAAGAASPTGGIDPIAALRSLREADGALDDALDAVREEGQRDARARASLPAALRAARAEVHTTRAYLDARRGVVGSGARTTLARAEQRLDEAERSEQDDPAAALSAATEADALAEAARDQADDDADSSGWGGPGGGGSGGYGGPGRSGGWNSGWGGGWGSSGGGSSFGGAVLGGILGGILSGGGGGGGGSHGGGYGGGGGGFGGGGFGGGSGGGGFGGGSGGGSFGGGSGGGSF